MIQVTRFDGSKFFLNAELIQSIEGTPDTVITLVNNTKVVVKEAPGLVVEKVIHYQRQIHWHPEQPIEPKAAER